MITDAYVTTIIAQAQRAAADYLYQAALLSSYGNDPDELYAKGNLCLDGAENLQAINDLTNYEKQVIIDRLLLCGGIANYSAVPITFGTVTVVYPASLTAKLSTLTDGPGGGTGTLVGQEYRVPAVKANGLAWEYKKPGFQGTVLYVSPSGVSGESEKGNIIYHYPTIALAETAASSGDTIVIMPGTYTANGLGKDGVTYYFMPGAVNSSALNMFNLNAAMTVKVRGNGIFTITGSSVTLAVFAISHASGVLDAEFEEINTSTTASTPVNQSNGTVTLKGRIKSNYNNAAGHCIIKSGGTLKLNDVTMITTNASAFEVSGTGAQDVYAKKAYTNALTQDSDVTYIIENPLRDSNLT